MVILGPEGFLLNYADDVYMGGLPANVARAMSDAILLYNMIGLTLGWGPKKTKLILPTDCDPSDLTLPRDASDRPLPDVVTGFKACLGVPRHPNNNISFIADALGPFGSKHDNLLDLVASISEEEDPFGALRLMQVAELTDLATS
jgi:hypothetical protein